MHSVKSYAIFSDHHLTMDSQSWKSSLRKIVFFFTLSLHYGTLPVAVAWRSLLLSECWPASNLKKLFSIEIFALKCCTRVCGELHHNLQTTSHVRPNRLTKSPMCHSVWTENMLHSDAVGKYRVPGQRFWLCFFHELPPGDPE